jgi:DNA-binding LytR/AlgR family response regulator
MIIRCIAIDDEPPALKQIENYVKKIPFLELKKSFLNAVEPLRYLKENKIDLIFLDIEMDDFTGIQFIKTLKNRPKIILTTAYDSYALEAFDLEVTDYLLKPISFERFLHAADKVYDQLTDKVHDQAISTQDEYKRDYIFLKTEYRIQRVDFDDILYIEGMKEYLRIYTKNEKLMILQSFKKMESLLPPENFIRVHRSYIVALNKIDTVERNKIKIGDKTIPVGEKYKKGFFEKLS